MSKRVIHIVLMLALSNISMLALASKDGEGTAPGVVLSSHFERTLLFDNAQILAYERGERSIETFIENNEASGVDKWINAREIENVPGIYDSGAVWLKTRLVNRSSIEFPVVINTGSVINGVIEAYLVVDNHAVRITQKNVNLVFSVHKNEHVDLYIEIHAPSLRFFYQAAIYERGFYDAGQVAADQISYGNFGALALLITVVLLTMMSSTSNRAELASLLLYMSIWLAHGLYHVSSYNVSYRVLSSSTNALGVLIPFIVMVAVVLHHSLQLAAFRTLFFKIMMVGMFLVVCFNLSEINNGASGLYMIMWFSGLGVGACMFACMFSSLYAAINYYSISGLLHLAGSVGLACSAFVRMYSYLDTTTVSLLLHFDQLVAVFSFALFYLSVICKAEYFKGLGLKDDVAAYKPNALMVSSMATDASKFIAKIDAIHKNDQKLFSNNFETQLSRFSRFNEMVVDYSLATSGQAKFVDNECSLKDWLQSLQDEVLEDRKGIDKDQRLFVNTWVEEGLVVKFDNNVVGRVLYSLFCYALEDNPRDKVNARILKDDESRVFVSVRFNPSKATMAQMHNTADFVISNASEFQLMVYFSQEILRAMGSSLAYHRDGDYLEFQLNINAQPA